jgi:hypothetical protein
LVTRSKPYYKNGVNMRGLEYLDEEWQDETKNFERINHRPKLYTEEQPKNRQKDGVLRRESQKIHELKYSK